MTLPEPSNILTLILIWVVPFLAYYLGVLIRKKAYTKEKSPDLSKQFLMAIPVCLIVVAPIVATLDNNGALSQNMANYFFTIGIIIEHGMLMQRKLTEQLATIGKNNG